MERLIEFSHRYGADASLVIAGGGNTSMKENGVLYIKGSGTALATIEKEGFVAMDMQKLSELLKKKYPAEDAAREAEFLADVSAARLAGQEEKRPSVETLLHAIFPQRYVLHLHPSLVNGMTCGIDGAAAAERLFPDAVWVPECRPGYTLAKLLADKLSKSTDTAILQNHGVFFAADTAEELDKMLNDMLKRLSDEFEKSFNPAHYSEPKLEKPFTPDQIVYCGTGPVLNNTKNAALVWEDVRKIAHYAAAFGGSRPMSEDLTEFILNWEAENYRRKKI